MPRNFFLALGLGEFCTGDAWNLPSEGTGVVGCRLDSPAQETGALAPVPFYLVHDRWRARTDTHAIHIVRTTTTTRAALFKIALWAVFVFGVSPE